VVGSRPTGWWRDRAGAAKGLHQAIAVADLGYDVVVLVLEETPCAASRLVRTARPTTVHAPGSGDDAIVEQLRTRCMDRDDPVVVTADRMLRERVAAAGGSLVGPSWLPTRTS
jgi:hypothetical protein